MIPYHSHHQNRRFGNHNGGVKRIIQFSVLLAVVLWLAYQVKHSTDNVQQKVDYSRKDEDGSNDGQIELYLGRKGRPGYNSDAGSRNKEDDKLDDSVTQTDEQEEAAIKENITFSEEGLGEKRNEPSLSQDETGDKQPDSSSHEETVINKDGQLSSHGELGNKEEESSSHEDISNKDEESSSHGDIGIKESELSSHEDVSAREQLLSSHDGIGAQEQELPTQKDNKQQESLSDESINAQDVSSSDESTSNTEEGSSTHEGHQSKEEFPSQEGMENKEDDSSQGSVNKKVDNGGQDVDQNTGEAIAEFNKGTREGLDRNESEKSNEAAQELLEGDRAISSSQSEGLGEEREKFNSQDKAPDEEDGKVTIDGSSKDKQRHSTEKEDESSDGKFRTSNDDGMNKKQSNSHSENNNQDEENSNETSDRNDNITKSEENADQTNEITSTTDKSDRSSDKSAQHSEEQGESDKGINGFHDENGVPDSDTNRNTYEHNNEVSITSDAEDLKFTSSEREGENNGHEISTSYALQSEETSGSEGGMADSRPNDNSDTSIVMPTDKENSTSKAIESQGEHAEDDEITNGNQVESDKTKSRTKSEENSVSSSETGVVTEESQADTHDFLTVDAHPESKLEDGDSESTAPSPQTQNDRETQRREEF